MKITIALHINHAIIARSCKTAAVSVEMIRIFWNRGLDVFAGSGADFQGGHTHAGMLNSAHWLLNNETQTLKQLLEENPAYELHFIGHSLGAGSRAPFFPDVLFDSA